MPWAACILFGAIVSATDPVAVVSLLKELGAPKQLATMIEGESLLNDGTAYVVFLIAKDMLTGKCLTPVMMGTTFFRLAFGGVLLGLISAEFLKMWLGRIHNNSVLEVNLTICFCYLTFYIAEIPSIHVSGILAVVTLGLWMSREGKTTISTDSEQAVHNVWMVLGFGAETLIFLISGIMIGYHNIISFENVGKSIVLWVLLVIIRFVLLMGFLPCMQRMGYKMDWRHVALMTWGGLRGALAVFLALIVVNEHGIDKEISKVILFHSSMIALLTLMVNGTTTGILVEKLKLSKESDTTKKFMYIFTEKVHQHSLEVQEQLLKKDNTFLASQYLDLDKLGKDAML